MNDKKRNNQRNFFTMARPGITKNDVFKAATELVGRGGDPTIEQIRGILGTGSNSTIAGFLREWRALHAKGDVDSLNNDLPSEFIGLMKGLWQRLLNQSESKVTAIEKHTEQHIAELNAELNALKKDCSLLQQQNEQLKQEKNALISDKLALEQVVIKKDQEITSLTTHNEGLSAQITEKEHYLAELSRLHKQVQENLEHFREASREQRLLDQERHSQQIQQAEGSIKQLKQELAVITQEKLTIMHQADILMREKDALNKLYEATVQKRDKLENELSQLQKAQGESEQKAQHWQVEHEKGQKKIDGLNLTLINLQKQVAILSQQLSVANEATQELKEQHKMLSHEKWEVAQEKAHLMGQLKQMQEMIGIRS
jgi:chromosome segregation ATPase